VDISKKKFVIEDICLGDASGETEADYNENFEHFYYSTDAVKKLLNPKSYFILGRKGVGKTLLSRFFCKTQCSESHQAVCISFRDFEFIQLREFREETIPEREYYYIWQWCLLLHVARLVIATEEMSERREYSTLKQFLDKAFGLELNQRRVLEQTQQLEFSGGLKEILFGKRTVGEKIGKNFYTDYLDALLSILIDITSGSDVSFSIFCDDLDDNFGSSFYFSSFESLIHAAVSLNRAFNQKGSKVKVILLLRSDIFLSLNFSNLSKYKRDHSVVLDWQLEQRENSPLISLVLHKIVKSLDVDYPDNLSAVYYNLFPEKIDGRRSVSYLIDMTMSRPRDIISLLQSAINIYPKYSYFAPEVLKHSKLSYSRELLLDLKNEIKGHIDNEKIEQYFALIRNLGKNTFDIAELIKRKGNLVSHLGGEEEARRVISFLFRFGVVGNIFHSSDNPQEITSFSWSYREDTFEPDFDARFKIHPGLSSALRSNSFNK
jgi:hypothetical protein